MIEFFPALLDWLQAHAGDDVLEEPFLGLRVATERPLSAYEDLALAAATGGSVSRALRRVTAFAIEGNVATQIGGSIGRQANEFWVALLVRFVREATSVHVVPCRVELAHARTCDSSALEGFLDTRAVAYSARRTSVVFPQWVIDLDVHPLGTWTAATRLLRSLVDVRFAIRQTIAAGEVPNPRTLAVRLNLSPRLLQRKLFEWGTTIRIEVDAIRRELAETYVQNADISTQEIAVRLGYPAARAFERAFFRWRGVSISEFRQAG